jgi:hypothetical protein
MFHIAISDWQLPILFSDRELSPQRALAIGNRQSAIGNVKSPALNTRGFAETLFRLVLFERLADAV